MDGYSVLMDGENQEEKVKLALSIAGFVLANPFLEDIVDAYNRWVDTARSQAFPWGTGWMPVFCLEVFDLCINKLSPRMLRALYEMDRSARLSEERARALQYSSNT